MEDTEAFPQGCEVQTHSLTRVEFNALTGVITGPPVEKNGIRRLPVSLQMPNLAVKKCILLQSKNLTLIKSKPTPPAPGPSAREDPRAAGAVEMRECRCMFCGEALLLESEEAAVAHMEVCPCLQEQLNDTEHQFTLPQSMK